MFEEPEEYDRYHRFATEECLLQAGGVLCPQPGCGAGILPDNPGERKIKCVQCSYVFCKNCHQGYHEDEDCETEEAFESLTTNQNLQATVVSNPEMALQARWQEQSSIAIKVQYIYLYRELLPPAVCFTELVKTGLWSVCVWAEQQLV